MRALVVFFLYWVLSRGPASPPPAANTPQDFGDDSFDPIAESDDFDNLDHVDDPFGKIEL